MVKKIAAIGIAMLFVLMIFPMATLSAADYTPIDGDTVDISLYNPGDTVQIQDGYSVTVTGTNTNIRIVCAGNVTLTIDDLSITNTSGSPISFSGTGNALVLVGASTLVGGSNSPGIRVAGTTALTISSVTGGSVNTTGGYDGAGIGGGSGGNGGIITVTGGTVNATGGDSGAGIGGGDSGAGSTITISGGSVTARGGYFGAGIGGGDWSDGGTVTISGGSVNAIGGASGAGIGGGYGGYGNTITISGGSVTANGGNNGAGIGGGFLGAGGTVAIYGGTVNATGGQYGAGIGGGYARDGGTIAISDGSVTANGGYNGAGIGGGYNGAGGAVNVSGGKVFAAAGTGGGQDIGHGEAGATTGSLAISESAVVFLRKDSSLLPVTTTTHTHEIITTLDDGAVYGITMPAGWTPNIGAYLHFNTLSFDANSGTGTISAITGLNQVTVTLPTADVLSRANYSYAGWNTAADGSGTAALPGDAYTLNGTETLFAQWTANPSLSASLTSPINVGESITLTPNIAGGVWDFDTTALQRDGDVFTGLVAGAQVITYTVDGESVSFDLTLMALPTPTPTPTPTSTPTPVPTAAPTSTPDGDVGGIVKTGEVQSQLPTVLMLVGVGLLMVYGGSVFTARKKRGENK